MGMQYSKKAFVLTVDTVFAKNLEDAFIKSGLVVVKEGAISTLANIKENLVSAKGSAGFIRSELLNFIKGEGMPLFIVIDCNAEIGLRSEDDPDQKKLLRTIMLSYIIFSMSKEFEDIHVNILLASDRSDRDEAFNFSKFPVRILDGMNTNNEQINTYIWKLKQNPILLNRYLSINAIDRSAKIEDIEKIVATYVKLTESRKAMKEKIESIGEKIEKSKQENEPAIVVVRVDRERLAIDGAITKDISGFEELHERHIQIKGCWTSKTAKIVNDKIKKAITANIYPKKYTHEEEIVIDVRDDCTVDGFMVSTIASFVVGEMGKYKIKIYASPKNYEVFRKSQAYQLVKDHIRLKS